jgi:hypothetical protein
MWFGEASFAKVGVANSEKKRLEEKLIGLRFYMEDHKALASKAQDFVVGCNHNNTYHSRWLRLFSFFMF